MKLFLTMLLIFSFNLLAMDKFSDDQLQILDTVRKVAKQTPDTNGKTYEDTMSAICLTESSAGANILGDFQKNIPITKASLGVMQVQVQTARYVAQEIKELRWVSKLSDSQIANRLLSDPVFSAKVATHYFILLKKNRKDYMKSISGYNGGFINKPYYERVLKSLDTIKELKEAKKIS